MKKPWLAFLLNFLLAGAGLAYLRLWLWAVVNLVGVLFLGFVLTRYVAADQLGWVFIALPVVNGILAQAVAQSMNAKLKLQMSQQQSPQTGQQSSGGPLPPSGGATS